METEFNVYEIEVDSRSKPDDEFGGDMECVRTFKTKQSALKFAHKLSFKEKCANGKKFHEAWVEKSVDGENEEQWGIRKGVSTYHIVLLS